MPRLDYFENGDPYPWFDVLVKSGVIDGTVPPDPQPDPDPQPLPQTVNAAAVALLVAIAAALEGKK